MVNEPGETIHKHRLDNCEELYYVISGRGVVGAGDDRAEVRGGHVHWIDKGVEQFMANASRSEPLEVIGVLTGAAASKKWATPTSARSPRQTATYRASGSVPCGTARNAS